MKKIIAILLCIILVVSGCTQQNTSNENKASDIISDSSDTDEKEQKIYTEEVSFDGLDDSDLLDYVEDSVYSDLVYRLSAENYFVQNVEAVYISNEYLEELEYNSQANVFFGYTSAELDEQFEGSKYVFTLDDNGATMVKEFEEIPNETYAEIMKNVAVGTGVILVCVTVSVGTAGTAPAVSMIFAAAAKTGTTMALSSGVMSGVAEGLVTAYQTGDFEQALEAGALAGSEAFKWSAIMGTIAGGASQAAALKYAAKYITMDQAAIIQKESGYPLDVIKQFHSMEEYAVFRDAGLKPQMINGKTALVRADIDLNFVDDTGMTNLELMKKGQAPYDSTGKKLQLHHIGQENDGTLAILTELEHDAAALHGYKASSEIDRAAFKKIREKFWIEMAELLEKGAV